MLLDHFTEYPFGVPDQPTWIERVPTILAFLESEDAPLFLDRPAVERLFGLRRRQAIELLRRCGGYQVGKTFLVLRETMVQFLNEPVTAAKVAVCFAQKRRVVDSLTEAWPQQSAPKITLPVSSKVLAQTFSDLPGGIELASGQLKITFTAPVELLEKLFTLSQALANDYESFEASVTSTQKDVPA